MKVIYYVLLMTLYVLSVQTQPRLVLLIDNYLRPPKLRLLKFIFLFSLSLREIAFNARSIVRIRVTSADTARDSRNDRDHEIAPASRRTLRIPSREKE